MKMSAVKNFTFLSWHALFIYANFPTKCPYRFINKFNYGRCANGECQRL